MSAIGEMNASQLLDKACQYESEGKQSLANKAFEIALKRDESEHKTNPATASLQRN